MDLLFIINVLLIFTVSIALTVITMETLKPALWVWHIINPVYFIILFIIFLWK